MSDTHYDWFLVTSTTVTYPTRDGGSTTTLANGSAPAGSRVEVGAVVRIAGGTAGCNLFHGDGTTAYFSSDSANSAGFSSGFRPSDYSDGFSASSTAASNTFLIFYRVKSNI